MFAIYVSRCTTDVYVRNLFHNYWCKNTYVYAIPELVDRVIEKCITNIHELFMNIRTHLRMVTIRLQMFAKFSLQSTV